MQKDFAESIHMKNDAKVITPDEYWDSLRIFNIIWMSLWRSCGDRTLFFE